MAIIELSRNCRYNGNSNRGSGNPFVYVIATSTCSQLDRQGQVQRHNLRVPSFNDRWICVLRWHNLSALSLAVLAASVLQCRLYIFTLNSFATFSWNAELRRSLSIVALFQLHNKQRKRYLKELLDSSWGLNKEDEQIFSAILEKIFSEFFL